ncbi:MAG: TIGR01212 family radical SAM protein [Tissierellia bacterium]|nr:TIGR01212 family radical SAM protein [Tissierellia bacterium]
MTLVKPYNSYSEYLQKKYGTKVYKLPIKLDNITCPNRDGKLGYGGCIFCSESGGSFENVSSTNSIRDQLSINKAHISKKYKAEKFIAYFQNFTNTYMQDHIFFDYINQCKLDDIVSISISTRPDCISYSKLAFLSNFQKENSIDIEIELGLQTVNYHILKKLNRGHGLAEFLDVMNRIKMYGLRTCVHIIIGLPWEDDIDIIETAKILNVMGVDEVKLHSLYIVKDTKLAEMYDKGLIKPVDYKDFERRVILFLRHLDRDIVIQRLLGRVPEEESVFCNWGRSWRKIHDEIITKMNYNNIVQGDLNIER